MAGGVSWRWGIGRGGVLWRVGYSGGGVIWGGVLQRWGTVVEGYCGGEIE